jgi:hypothetical protein
LEVVWRKKVRRETGGEVEVRGPRTKDPKIIRKRIWISNLETSKVRNALIQPPISALLGLHQVP